jgi:hypothetical protein
MHYTLAARTTRIAASVNCWVAPRKSPVMPPARAWKRHPHRTATITASTRDIEHGLRGQELAQNQQDRREGGKSTGNDGVDHR